MTTESTRTLLRPTKNLRPLRIALSVALLVGIFIGNASADEMLGKIGGPGGGEFMARCTGSELLAGFELRAADDVDAIRPLCVAVIGPRDTPSAASYSDWHGGGGGRSVYVVCPSHIPIVTGMFVSAEGQDTIVVNNIHLFCGFATDPQVPSDAATIVFDAPAYQNNSLYRYSGIASGTQHCPDGLVAVGMHGRSGIWLDAIGLICGAAPLAAASPPPHVEIDRTSTSIAPEKAMTALASNASVQMTSRITGLHGSAASRAAVPVATPAAPASAPALTPEKINRGSIGGEIPLADGSIRIEVRYPIAYGYQYANAQGAFGNLGIYSCDAFSVTYLVSPQDPERYGLIGVTTGMPMRTGDGEYICDTVISNLPRNVPVIVRVAMSGHRTSAGDVWLDGSQPQPGWQQVRSIVNGEQQVILTTDQPSAVLRFEMIYAGSR